MAHRIDKETSGIMLLAKSQTAYLHLKGQFQAREVSKKYLAFLHGETKEDHGIINRPIGRSKNDFRKWTAERGTRGELREAVTSYVALLRNKGFTYAEISPKTGRTHQIRVHFKAINHPVVCDKLYAPNKASALGFTRLALHAFCLEFSDLSGERMKVEAPLSEDFQKAARELGFEPRVSQIA